MTLKGISITQLDRITVEGGDVLRGLRSDEDDYNGFAELYFSQINYLFVKGWKLHTNMTMNLIVPYGKVRFVFSNLSECKSIISSQESYHRLTVPPGIWFAFQGLSSPYSVVANLSNLIHDASEVQRLPVDSIHYDWRLVN